MITRICETFGIEFPIFAYSDCRDVVAAVSRAGGMGVLGALAISPEQLEIELSWIDDHVDGKPYGVDVVMPASLAGSEVDKLEAMIPEAHRRWVEELLEQHNVPPLPEDEAKPEGLLAWTHDKAKRQVEIALTHPIKLIANALGTPPAEVIEQAHASGVLVAALVGSAATLARTWRLASTSSSRRGPKPAATPARSPAWSSFRKSWKRCDPPQCSPPVESEAGVRWRP